MSETKKNYWVKTSREMLGRVRQVGAMPFVLYQYYLTYRNSKDGCYPSLETTARDLGLFDKHNRPSKSAVCNLKKILFTAGWIKEENGKIIFLDDSEFLNEIETAANSEILNGHSEFLNSESDRSEILNDAGKSTDDRSEILNDHSEILNPPYIRIEKEELERKKERQESLSARGRGENLPEIEPETEILENGMRGISAENLFGLSVEEAETKFTRLVIDGLKDRLKYPATLPKEFEWKKAVERAWKNKFPAGQCLDVFDLLEKITKLKGGHWGISPPYWEGNIGRVEALRRELEDLEKKEAGNGKLPNGNRNGKFDRKSPQGGGATKSRRVDLSRFKGPDNA